MWEKSIDFAQKKKRVKCYWYANNYTRNNSAYKFYLQGSFNIFIVIGFSHLYSQKQFYYFKWISFSPY